MDDSSRFIAQQADDDDDDDKCYLEKADDYINSTTCHITKTKHLTNRY